MITDFFGVAGLILILTAFVLELFDVIKEKGYPYLLMNFFGSVFLGVYAYLLSNLIFIILNAVWAFASLYELVVIIRKKK